MECSCDISYNPDDVNPSFFTEKKVKARKQHKCHECYKKIELGEYYTKYTGKWDGQIDTYNICEVCKEIEQMFLPYGRFFGRMFEDIQDYLYQEDGNIPESCLSKLSPQAREIICEKIEDVWEDMGDE